MSETIKIKAKTVLKFRITGKGIKSLRNKLGITQVELAKLADVSEQTVVGWEKKGKVVFKKPVTADKIQQLRSCGKRQVREMLGSDSYFGG